MVKCVVLLCVTILITQVGICNSFIHINDSLDVKEKIKARGKVCKQLQKKRVIYKLNTDTLLLLGRNKAETIVGYVAIVDSKNNQTKTFIYDSTGLFSVTVREKVKKTGSKKDRVCYYVFEKGLVVWRIEEGLVCVPTQLLGEATFVRDYVAPFRTSLR